jgi:Beta-galactosidase
MMKHLFDSLTLTVAIISFFFVLGNVTMAQDQVKIFSLLKPDLEPQQGPPELHDPRIYGLSWRFKWSTIEPQQDQYNWQPIDKAIEVSSKAGKKVMLRVIAGINTPEWVYQSGANPFYFSNTDLGRSENYPSSLRMPIPWDDIYLAKWEGFIRAFGMRYNRNPHIYSIQMTGGGYIGEMNLPKAHAKWQQAGYSDAKLIMAWKRMIDSYQKAFPDIPTNLAINEPLGGKRSDVLAPIVSYVLINYPHKVYLQQNGLQANFPRDSRIRQIIREASGKTVVGYQMLGGKEFLEGQTGDRIIAFRNAREDLVSYVEVYASDVRDPGQNGALQFLATGSERR